MPAGKVILERLISSDSLTNIEVFLLFSLTAAQQIISPTLSPIRVLDPVDELEEATTKNPIIMENPTSIQIVKGNVGLGNSLNVFIGLLLSWILSLHP